MSRMNIYMDSDPGIDDAVAFALLAANRERFNILAIGAVAGNQTSEKVVANTVMLGEMLRLDAPVLKGAEEPLIRKKATSDAFHGSTGLGEFTPPQTDRKSISDNSFIYIRNKILSSSEPTVIIATGPLSDIALLLKTFPEVKEKIERIIFMGGSSGRGNRTEYAEYNIWADPEAARIVLTSGIPAVMCALDITLKCGMKREEIQKFLSSSSFSVRAYGEMLDFYSRTPSNKDKDIITIHDAVTLMYVLHPEIFNGRYVSVDVDCSSTERRGQTVCKDVDEKQANAYLLDFVDQERFEEYLIKDIASL